ncbi:hypothetical protein, partial [Pseudomonas sp. GD03696]|uniref:hypothetical protein n=1 Tax=Pseudomonas sp. GD03696 TaxID=2975368 RepID=UPI00244A4C5C
MRLIAVLPSLTAVPITAAPVAAIPVAAPAGLNPDSPFTSSQMSIFAITISTAVRAINMMYCALLAEINSVLFSPKFPAVSPVISSPFIASNVAAIVRHRLLT